MGNLPEHSNGESAFLYFTQRIEEDGLYLLDEPENSLSPTRQQELCQFLEDSARFFHCQFVIATHSPFLLSMQGAKVYDLDADPVTVRRWTELPAVRAYYDFFQAHAKEFGKVQQNQEARRTALPGSFFKSLFRGSGSRWDRKPS